MSVSARRWFCHQGEHKCASDVQPGDVIAIDHSSFRHRPWLVHDIRPHGDRWSMIIRPVGAQYDLAQYNQSLSFGKYAYVDVLPEHYSVCVKCGELPPCSEVWARDVAKDAVERTARYEVEGICPACQQPVTGRQRAHRFEENLYVPLGPPVVFHTRRRCVWSAIQYDTEVAKAIGRDPLLSCTGLLVHHHDDHYECTNITCPSVKVRHGNHARCHVLTAKCNRPECWAIEERRWNGSRAGDDQH